MLIFIIGYGSSVYRHLAENAGERARIIKVEDIKPGDISQGDTVFIYAPKLPDDVINAIYTRANMVISATQNFPSYAPDDIVLKAIQFFKRGGRKNLVSLIDLLLDGKDNDIDEIPWCGIYHPEYGVFESLENYKKKYGKKIDVGVLFYRTHWLYGNTQAVDAIVRALEQENLGVVAVFTHGWKDEQAGIPSKEDAIKRFLAPAKIDAIVNLTYFFLSEKGRTTILEDLNIPVFQPVFSFRQSVEEWKACNTLDGTSQVYTIYMPEVDGLIESIFFGGTRIENGEKKIEILEEHAKYIAKRIARWIRLRRKPPKERRIAIVLINPPCKGAESSVAVGLGLDVPESVVKLLHTLKSEGYHVENIPQSGEHLIRMILERHALNEFRWTSVKSIVEGGGALALVDLEKYLVWYRELSQDLRDKIEANWGKPEDVLSENVPDELIGMVYNGCFVVPGLRFGNVVIIPQPKFGCAGAKCDGKVCKILHDPTIVPPHQWFAVYRWLTREFGADVLIHFGTHGSLEFRPGKGVALSPNCIPEVTIDDVPHLYVYAVSNPMEGAIAKRRSYAVLVDHIYPPMENANVLENLDSLVRQYFKAREVGDNSRMDIIQEQIIKEAKEIGITVKESPEVIEQVGRYIELMRSTAINMGLHIFGKTPDDEKIAKYVISAFYHDSTGTPSIIRILSECTGIDYDSARRRCTPRLEKIRKSAEDAILDVVKGKDFEHSIKEACEKHNLEIKSTEPLKKIKDSILSMIHGIKRCDLEMRGLLNGLDGGHVPPGTAGALTRGCVDILPTGKNFYTVNPLELPSRAAWKIGVLSAQLLIQKHLEKHGQYPETVGEVLWSIDAYKADGEQISRILYLLGVEPVWSGSQVVDLKVIPLHDLGRPRIDVLVRISGIVRDTLPTYVEMINHAVEMVLSLDEPPEMNYPRKHYFEIVRDLITTGYDDANAQKLAGYRVFSSPPGTYGAGVNLAVAASAWRDKEDLAKIWVKWSSYAYSLDGSVTAPHVLMHTLKTVEVVAKNHISDEHDITNCCCYYAHHGGFKLSAELLSGKEVDAVHIDTRDITNIDIRDISLEAERVARTKILNPQWIEEMKKHGYRGAAEFAKKIHHLYGWKATANAVSDRIFDEIADRYIIDSEMRHWFEEHNIYAAEEITRRLVEAHVRGLWKTSKERIDKLNEAYSEIEALLEDMVHENTQGGEILLYAYDDVNVWNEKMREVNKLWQSLKEK